MPLRQFGLFSVFQYTAKGPKKFKASGAIKSAPRRKSEFAADAGATTVLCFVREHPLHAAFSAVLPPRHRMGTGKGDMLHGGAHHVPDRWGTRVWSLRARYPSFVFIHIERFLVFVFRPYYFDHCGAVHARLESSSPRRRVAIQRVQAASPKASGVSHYRDNCGFPVS